MSGGATIDAPAHVRRALEAAWPGVRVLQLWCSHQHTQLAFSGDEALLIRLGLLSAELAAGIPRCGVAVRRGVTVIRRKRITAVHAGWTGRLSSERGVSCSAHAQPIAAAFERVLGPDAPAAWASIAHGEALARAVTRYPYTSATLH